MKTIKIGDGKVGDGNPCYVLAEAGCNHNANIDIARKLIDMSVEAGADGIKFQTYKAELMYSKKTPMMKHFKDRLTAKDDATMYDLIKMTELPYDMHAPIVNYCKENNIPFLSTPFDEESLDFLDGFDVPAYKIAAFEMTHFPLLRKVAQKGKPIILSTGMSSLGDIEKAIEIIYRENNNQVVLLHCVSNYPAQPEDYNLRVINTLKAAFGLPVGLSDHTFGIEVSKIAISIGANLIEKHITIDQKLPGPDHYFSLTKEELTELTQFNKLADKALGSPIKKCTEAEKPMKNIGRRSLVAGVDIPSGTKITRAMIEVKRPGTGLDTGLISTLLGTETRRDIERDEPLSWDMFLKYPD
jgi:sialic acid synthase SpsE